MTKPCGVALTSSTCVYPRKATKTKCEWHWLLRQPIEVQVRAAELREKTPTFGQVRRVVPAKEWPEGERWCSGCQHFIPDFYTRGSRCRACASRATHAAHIQRTYGLDVEEYQRLLEWQGGRCYICRQVPRSRRLAVDHDHETGAVRGLLCANDEFGCNVQLRRLLNDVEMARRALEYVEQHPLERMRGGQPATPVQVRRDPLWESLRRGPQDVSSAPLPSPPAQWDPWAS